MFNLFSINKLVSRSRADLLQLFQVKISICCIVPIVVTLGHDLFKILDAITNVSKYSSEERYLGLPFVLIWSFVLFLSLVVHISEIIVSRTLITSWAPRHSKRN